MTLSKRTCAKCGESFMGDRDLCMGCKITVERHAVRENRKRVWNKYKQYFKPSERAKINSKMN